MHKNKLSYLSYLWTIIVNIFTVFIVISIFNSIYESFEIIITSIAILIYLNLNTFVVIWAQTKQSELLAINDEFKKIRILLKEDIAEKTQKKDNKIKFYINLGFSFIIYTITIIELIGALN